MPGAEASTRDVTTPWSEAVLAAALYAIDPAGLGGIALRAHAGPVRDNWLALVQSLLPCAAPFRKVPIQVSDGRLLGGLDLAATLQAGRPIAERGLLAACDGGTLVLPSAERRDALVVARLGAVMDRGAVVVERDGFANVTPSRFGVIALDEATNEDERPPPALLDRLAFHCEIDSVGYRETHDVPGLHGDVTAARARGVAVSVPDRIIEALCAASLALGVASLRAPLLAVKAAQAHAALNGRIEADSEDASAAARLVLAPRATMLPASEEEAGPPQEQSPPETPPETPPDTPDDDSAQQPVTEQDLQDLILAAAAASIPAGLLVQLKLTQSARTRVRSQGRSGAFQKSKSRGRPAGVVRGELRDGARLNVIETLRAAAPWQPLRRREAALRASAGANPARVEVRRDDFRIARFKNRTETATVFVVDASGSAALNRLAEAKGAVELLLADCYVRRDSVALIAFRGTSAEVLLPPTRSLVRAKRSLAGLPGGGGTPLAAAIDQTVALADGVRRKGQTMSAVFLTDGRANVARDGRGGRAQATDDAIASAKVLRALGLKALVIDTSPNPSTQAETIAREMGAVYLALPRADAQLLSNTVRQATEAAGRDA